MSKIYFSRQKKWT